MVGTTAEEGALRRGLWRLAGGRRRGRRWRARRGSTFHRLNEMFDDQAARLSALNNRVPGAVLALEVIGAAIALGLLALHISVLGRGLIALMAAAALVTLLLLVTFDLDRPTRGLIAVPDTALRAVRASVRASMTLPPAAGGPGR